MKIQLRPLSFPIAVLILGSLAVSLTAGTICPAVGIATPGTGANAGTGCFVLFTYSNNANGGIQITRTIDPTVLRYDSMDGDDTTVGVVNHVANTTAAFFITELDLTPTNPAGDFSGPNIFNFDGDGICDVTPSVSGSCPFSSVGPAGSVANGYSGPEVTFQALTVNSGKVFFNGGGIGPGQERLLRPRRRSRRANAGANGGAAGWFRAGFARGPAPQVRSLISSRSERLQQNAEENGLLALPTVTHDCVSEIANVQ